MKFCPSCGKPYEEGAHFCNGCGNTLSTQTPPQSTPQSRPVVDDDDEKTVFLGDMQQKEAIKPAEAPVQTPDVPVQAPAQAPIFTPPVTPAKKKKTPIIIAAVVAAIVIIGIVLAVILGSGDKDKDTDSDKENTSQSTTENASVEASSNTTGSSSETPSDSSGGTETPVKNGDIAMAPAGTTKLESDNLSYVLVYNPTLYDERDSYDKTALNTGDFSGSQVDIDSGRGDSLEENDPPYISMSQADLMLNYSDVEFELLDDKSGNYPGINYSLGDKHTFYHATSTDPNIRTESEFECVYAGEYCYIWINDSSFEEYAEDYGKTFDENIYEECVGRFGEPRFVGDSGKVNILIYDNMRGLLGFFHGAEIFSEKELSNSDIEWLKENKFNTDHAIIHINSDFIKQKDVLFGTLAHEFQHLLYRCSSINAITTTWLNEAMSGYIEEYLYPGTKEEAGHFVSFEESYLIREGQSLYNFNDDNFNDIGVYGSVYFYTEYLKKLTGSDDIFSDIHSYWNDISDGSESEALYDSVSSSTKSEIDSLIVYPDEINLSEEDEWMSKLTLDFYLNILSNEMDIPNHSEFDTANLLYDDLSGASIEGGGRIILSVKNGEFDIPADSDNGLIYIGLDKDFNVVTDYIYK